MLTRSLTAAVAILAAVALYQHFRIGSLEIELASATTTGVAESRAIAAGSLEGSGPEMERTIAWLDEFYKSSDGLQRPDGLWIAGHPDYTGIGGWVFDVYLRSRLRGLTEAEARQKIVDAIRQSEEWRSKHRS